MKIALIQMRSEINARDENVAKACKYIDQAAEDQPEIIVLPELFNTGYFCLHQDSRYMDYAETDDGYTIAWMRQKAQEHRVCIVATIFERASAGHYYDTAMLIDPRGRIVGKYRKVHPSPIERMYFRSASKFRVFEVRGWRVGLLICYDNFFPESARCLGLMGAELIIAPFATGRPRPWEEVLVARAIDNQFYLAVCNHVGKEEQNNQTGEAKTFIGAGKSMIVDPVGEIVAKASATEEDIISVELDHNALVQARKERPYWTFRKPEAYRVICMLPEDLFQ
ncbi:MAG: carbon-nitrogen hydrolase family protein [Chloroflexi bacterium]|nr:carbon-nitrogen hydrolase family protein [Chloroflexota bacterium]